MADAHFTVSAQGASAREISCSGLGLFKGVVNAYAGDSTRLVFVISNTSSIHSLRDHRGVDSALGVVYDADFNLQANRSFVHCHSFIAPTEPGVYNRRLTWSANSSNGGLFVSSFDYELIVGENPFDTDFDGIPNVYEILTGLDPEADDAGLDLDRDGYTNLHEFLFGTPANDASIYPSLKIERTEGVNPIVLTVPTYPGNWYVLEISNDLITWRVQAVLMAQSTTLVISRNINLEGAFFRVSASQDIPS